MVARTVEFLCNGHLVTELSVDFAGKVCATIRGFYAWYFPVSEKELVQTARSLAHGMAVKCRLKPSRMERM